MSSDVLEHQYDTIYSRLRYPPHDFIEQAQLGNMEIALRVQKSGSWTDQLQDLKRMITIFQTSFSSHKMEDDTIEHTVI